jgi:hypothetical protein
MQGLAGRWDCKQTFVMQRGWGLFSEVTAVRVGVCRNGKPGKKRRSIRGIPKYQVRNEYEKSAKRARELVEEITKEQNGSKRQRRESVGLYGSDGRKRHAGSFKLLNDMAHECDAKYGGNELTPWKELLDLEQQRLTVMEIRFLHGLKGMECTVQSESDGSSGMGDLLGCIEEMEIDPPSSEGIGSDMTGMFDVDEFITWIPDLNPLGSGYLTGEVFV